MFRSDAVVPGCVPVIPASAERWDGGEEPAD